MPFTLSHPAAALLLRPLGLPMAATVAGTMAPDLPLFLHSPAGYRFTHSLLGVVTGDVAIALGGLVLWFVLLRDPLIDTAPAVLRERVPVTAGYGRRQWLLAMPAAVAGALTHVGWDELTHQGRWGATHVAWLRTEYLGRPGYSWAQAGSGVVGLLVVIAWVGVRLRRSPRVPRPARVPALTGRAPACAVAVGAVVGLITMVTLAGDGLHAMVLAAVVRGLAAVAVVLLVVALVWRWWVSRRIA